MKNWNYILHGFGYSGTLDFNKSLTGFINEKIIILTTIIGGLASFSESIFGVNAVFMTAYALLIIFETITGMRASRNRGERIESRKMGRMILKLGVYSTVIVILNLFKDNVDFPQILDFEMNPFNWLYWTTLLVIVWQLVISLLENLDQLNFKFAKILLHIINKKFYEGLKITEKKP